MCLVGSPVRHAWPPVDSPTPPWDNVSYVGAETAHHVQTTRHVPCHLASESRHLGAPALLAAHIAHEPRRSTRRAMPTSPVVPAVGGSIHGTARRRKGRRRGHGRSESGVASTTQLNDQTTAPKREAPTLNESANAKRTAPRSSHRKLTTEEKAHAVAAALALKRPQSATSMAKMRVPIFNLYVKLFNARFPHTPLDKDKVGEVRALRRKSNNMGYARAARLRKKMQM